MDENKKDIYGTSIWEDDEIIVTKNGRPIGMTISKKHQNGCTEFIERALPSIIREIEKQKGNNDENE